MNNPPPPPKKKIPKLIVMGDLVNADLQQLLQYADQVEVIKQQEVTMQEQLEECKLQYKELTYECPEHLSSQQNAKGIPYKRSEPKIGRNQLCPCGSNKKYKHCCLNKA